MKPDCELLRLYAECHDEAAFAEIVQRHVDLVYSVALRQTSGDAHLAEDASQVVFADLARKARTLSDRATLAGWLHTSARFAASKAVRGEQRRRVREHEANLMNEMHPATEINWEELRPLLDESVGQLEEEDRDAIVLRYFEGKSHRELGTILGLSENSANKRVERALEKLRTHFASRGVTVSSALLATAMSANSVQAAPAGLAGNVAKASLVGSGSSAAIGSAGLLALFMNTKTKMSLVIAVILIVAATVMIKLSRSNEPAVAVVPVPATTAPIQSQAVQPPIAATVVEPIKKPEVSPPIPEPVATTVAQAAPATSAPVVPGTTIEFKPQTELSGAIAQAIQIYQAQDYVGIARLYPPGSLDAYLTDGSQAGVSPRTSPALLAQMGIPDPRLLSAEDHIQGYAKSLRDDPKMITTMANNVQFLHAIQGQVPEMNDDGTRATFRVNPKIGNLDHLTFQKVDGNWYIALR